MHDVRFAVRALAAKPGFSALAVLTLAIGIGVNAVAFNALNGLLFKTTRFAGAETLGWITLAERGNPYNHISWPDYQDLARGTRALASIAVEARRPLSYQDGTTVRQIWASCVSANYFSTLQAQPRIGRTFAETDARGDLTVVVSERFWTEQLGGGDSIAGRIITLNGQSAAIAGVMPDAFQGPGGLFEPDVWVPVEHGALLGLAETMAARDRPWLAMVGRLAPGVTGAQAGADLQSLIGALPQRRTDPGTTRTATFWPVLDRHPELQQIAPAAYVGLTIVGLVLLLACFNVAGLLLARAADRQREIAVRTALGASRMRILRQFVIEGMLLALMSGFAAIVIAQWSADLLAAFSLPSPIPQRLHMGVDWRVLAFTCGLVVLAGVLPALLPAFHATRRDVLSSMKMDAGFGKQRSRMRAAFVVAQVAGSTLMLTFALLLAQGFWATAATDPGFESDRVMTIELKPSDFGYDTSRARTLFDQLLERVRTMPGVERAALADRVPFYVGYPRGWKISTEGDGCASADCRSATVYAAGPDHIAALGVPLRSGRDLTTQDVVRGDSVVVSEAMAGRVWPGQSPLGAWIRESITGRQYQVVGVAADITHRSFGEAPQDVLYRTLAAADYAEALTLVVRTRGSASAIAAPIQAQIHAIDPALPPGTAKTMAQRMEMPLWPVRTATGLFSICGVLALVLATVGLFGTTYLTVGQRTREFGIRAALGATRRRVMQQVLREGLWLSVPGLALGLLGAVIASRAAASVLVRLNVDVADPSIYLVSAALQLVVLQLACLVPAHRATRADPILALRTD